MSCLILSRTMGNRLCAFEHISYLHLSYLGQLFLLEIVTVQIMFEHLSHTACVNYTWLLTWVANRSVPQSWTMSLDFEKVWMGEWEHQKGVIGVGNVGETAEEVPLLCLLLLLLLVALVEHSGVLLLEGQQACSDVVKQERHSLYIFPSGYH